VTQVLKIQHHGIIIESNSRKTNVSFNQLQTYNLESVS